MERKGGRHRRKQHGEGGGTWEGEDEEKQKRGEDMRQKCIYKTMNMWSNCAQALM